MNNESTSSVSYSKQIAAVMFVIFIITLVVSFGFMIIISLRGTGEIVDYVVCTTAITVVASLLGLTLKSYYSKASLENVANIRKSVYREIMDVRLDYDERVLKLRREFNVSDEEIDEIELDAPFKEMSDAVINQTTNKLDEVDSKSEADVEIESML